MLKDVKRGEIYWADWDPARGSEQSGVRPALVIQNDVGNKYSSTTIVTAVTTAKIRPYPFTVNLAAKESGLLKESTVNLSQIMTIDRSRLKNKCGELNKVKMAEVDEAIKASLGI